MRTQMLAVAVASLGIATGLWARDDKPVPCKSALSYQGPPLYGERIGLPLDEPMLGRDADQDVRVRLDQAIEEAMRRTRATHMTAAVATRDTLWSATRSADRSASPPRTFYWASAGKALTAVVIMQLVEEGRLTLADPISRWVRGLPHGDFTTVDHLLLHTSGLFSANEDLTVRKKPRYLSPEETIRVSLKHGAMFCPGQAWRYSNTGYSILGQIIEATDGRPYHEAVNQRIAKRLGLPTLRALAPKESPSGVAPLTPADGSKPMLSPSWAYAAGSVVGTSEDLLRFWQALLTAKLVNAENTSRFFEHLYPMVDAGTYYGRGVMLYELPEENGTVATWLGHSGGTPGAKAVVAYSPAKRAFVAVALSGDGSAEASANLILRQLAGPNAVAQ